MIRQPKAVILLSLPAVTLLFAGVASAWLHRQVGQRLEAEVSQNLGQTPGLDHVSVAFSGFHGTLDGRVGSPELRELAERTAREAAPAVRIGAVLIDVPRHPPEIRLSAEDGKVKLAGRVADDESRNRLIECLKQLDSVRELATEELMVTGEVARADWLEPVMQFLPEFLANCTTGSAEISRESWKLAGTVSEAGRRNLLAERWQEMSPPSAQSDASGLQVGQIAADSPPKAAEVREKPRERVSDSETNSAAAHPESPGKNSPPEKPETPDALRQLLAKTPIYFPPGSSYWDTAEASKLDQLVRALKETGFDLDLEVVGFADSSGAAGFNELLSRNRAQRLQEFLKSKGVTIAATRTEILPAPKEGASEDERQRLRRAEVRILEPADG